MDRIEEFLQERKENKLFRTLHPSTLRREGEIYSGGKKFFDFSSNDYLGLSDHRALKEASKKTVDIFGTSSSASRLLSGDLDIHHELEEKTAFFKGKESALVFNSGYQANVGIISALYKKGDCIFSDRLNHASIIDGMILSGVTFFRFRHNDIDHLETLLKTHRQKFRNSLIITETVFSMDGDKVPLQELVKLKEAYNCEIMADEAHATGIFGKNGAGIVEEEGLTDKVDLIMGTFSKALGGFGAYLACSKKIREYLINACRSFIYSTALPPSTIAVDAASLDIIKEEPFRRRDLLENSDYFRNELKDLGYKVTGSSQIIPLVLGDSLKTIELSTELKDRGYWVFPIRPPTVPAGEARLRFSLTYHHKKSVLKQLINDISEVYRI